jgi:two-component system response regulator (stage 0 sporulation protein F)
MVTVMDRRQAPVVTRRILVVDDNVVIQDILKQFFGGRYSVVAASNASQALAAIIRWAPDVIVLDVKMPGVDGLALLKSLREMGVTTPIFVMTGYDSITVARSALGLGANGYLPKPFDLVHLDRLVADALGGEAALQGA